MAFQALNKMNPYSNLPPTPSIPSSTSPSSTLSQQFLQRPLDVQQNNTKFSFPTQVQPPPLQAANLHPNTNSSTLPSSTPSNVMSFSQAEPKRENSGPQRPRGHHVRNRLSISTATAALSMTDSEPQQPPSPNKGDTTPNSAAISRAKKKKGQKFYCQGFGDCNLSFTRSEHLLRHIRKHTGERPFTCHCGRAFSRLDNLRQHSQTVHADEVIPPDSLAATGTRYQRHVKTDRIRPAGRARSSTTNSNPDDVNNAQDDGDEMDFEADSPQSSIEDQQIPPHSVPATQQPQSQPPQQDQQQQQQQQQAQQQHLQSDEKQRPKARPRSLLLNQRHSQTRTVAFQDKPSEAAARDNNPYLRERELIDRYHPYVPPTSSAMTTPTSTTFSGFSPVTSPAFSPFSGHGPTSPVGSPDSPSWRSHSRRSSMPGVPQVTGQNPFFAPQTPSQRYLPSLSSRLSQATTPRDSELPPQSPSKKRERDPEEDNRRRTWHPGTFVGFQAPPDEPSQRSGQPSLAPPVPPMPTVTAPPAPPAMASRTVLPSVQSLLNSTPSPPSTFSSPIHSNRNSFVFPQPPAANNPSPMEPSLTSFETRRGSFTADFPRFTSENRKSMNLENSPKRHASPPPIPPRLRLDFLHNRTSSWAGPSPAPFSIDQAPEKRTYDDSNTPTRDDTFRNHRMSRNGLASNRSSFYGQSPQEHREREGSSEESENSEVAVATPASSVDYEQRYLNYKQVANLDNEANHRSIMSVSFANNPPPASPQPLQPLNQTQPLQNPPPIPQRSFARPRTINVQNSKPGALNEGKENGMGSSLDILAEVARIETNRTGSKMDMS